MPLLLKNDATKMYLVGFWDFFFNFGRSKCSIDFPYEHGKHNHKTAYLVSKCSERVRL